MDRLRWGSRAAVVGKSVGTLRTLISNGDFNAYWRYHLDRNTTASIRPDTAAATNSQHNHVTPEEPHPSDSGHPSTVESDHPEPTQHRQLDHPVTV